MDLVKAEIVERQASILPKGMRFLTWEGRRVFQSRELTDGTLKSCYEVYIICAPEEISDFDLKRSDVTASHVIEFPIDCTPQQFKMLLAQGIQTFQKFLKL